MACTTRTMVQGLRENRSRKVRAGIYLSIRLPHDAAALMDIRSLDAAPPFITKDGSEIRELLAYRNSSIRNQSLAEARLPAGASTQEHYHARTEEIYFITGGQGRLRLRCQPHELKTGAALGISRRKQHQLFN